MVLGPHVRQDENYRRGVVFGLTLGEAILLVLFSLLLAFAALFEQQEKKVTAQAVEVRHLNDSLKASEELVKNFTDPEKFPDGASVEDITKEYIASKIAQKKQREKLELVEERLAQADGMLTTIEQQLKLKDESLKGLQKDLKKNERQKNEEKKKREEFEKKQRAAEQLLKSKEESLKELAKDLQKTEREKNEEKRKREETERKQKAAEKLNKELKSKAQILAEQKDKAEKEAEQSKDKLDVANNKLRNLERRVGFGRGTEKPACWSVEKGKRKGAPEYIFDVALLPDGFVIHNRKIAHRTKEQSKLPLSNVVFEKSISSQQFKRQLKPLFDWSEAHDCRFFVAAFDNIPRDQKEIFKRQIDVMGERVYHYRYRDEQFPLDLREALKKFKSDSTAKDPNLSISEEAPDSGKIMDKGLVEVVPPSDLELNRKSKSEPNSEIIKPTPPEVEPRPILSGIEPQQTAPSSTSEPIQTEPSALPRQNGDNGSSPPSSDDVEKQEPTSEQKEPEFENPFSGIFEFIKKELTKEQPETQ